MTTTIELKEQMRLLREQQREIEKDQRKIKKEYDTWKMLMSQHLSFCYINNWQTKYASFEELIKDNSWTNTYMKKQEFEFLFNGLKYTDIDFFTAFMSWSPDMFDLPLEDRKCAVCLSYYNATTKERRKFARCDHYCCVDCYNHLPKNIAGKKSCILCRKIE